MDPEVREEVRVTQRLFPVRNRRGDVTKTRLIEATMSFVLEHGIECVTFDAVGQLAGMGAAQVKYHFGDKSYLIEQTMKYALLRYQEMVIKEMEDKSGYLAQVSAILEASINFAKQEPKAASLYLLFLHSASVFPKYKELQGQMFLNGLKRMKKILEPMHSRGYNDAQIESFAVAVWALIDGFLIYVATGDQERPVKQMKKDALLSIKKLLS